MASSARYFQREKENSYHTILSELKALGVKVPKIKKLKPTIFKQEISEKKSQIFGVGLNEQEWTSQVEYPVPKFIAWATVYLQKFIQQEIGLFRKAGNRARQRILRAKLEKGESLQDVDPNDVASLLKQWLRELPESLIPSYLQDLFRRCNCLDVVKDRVSACLFSILLLPPDHMYTLKHLLRFLSSVSLNSDKNKMGIENLAIIMAPNIFMTNKSAEKMNNLLNDHTAIIQVMIENSHKIGQSTIFQPTELYATLDTLHLGSNKHKRKTSGPLQDIFSGFKKLVGHNGSSFAWRNSSEDRLMETPRQALSLVNLDSPDFVTPKEKDETLEGKKIGARARRKSFGALLLRKKDRKRLENEIPLLVPEVVAKKLDNVGLSSENSKNIAALSVSCCKLSNLKLNNPLNIKERDDSNCLRNSKRRSQKNTIETVANDVITINKPVVRFSKSCQLQDLNKLKVFKTPLLPNTRNLILKIEKKKDKFGLSPQEDFSIKPFKQKSFSKINKTTDKENALIKTKDSVKNLNCSHSENSACNNTKCNKNQPGNCERKSEKRTKQKLCTSNLSKTQNNKNNTQTALLESGKISYSDVSLTAISSNLSEIPDLVDVSETSGSQSLDLSLKLLLQNFCISPPSGSSEIKVSIDIKTSNSNPELKLNISEKEAHQNRISTSETQQILENRATKTRLSSQSDSKIPRLKIFHKFSRQSSLSETVRGQTQHLTERSKRHSTKIPRIQNSNTVKRVRSS